MVAPQSILVVEDDSIVQLHLRVLLQEMGYEVSGVAATADEALALAAVRPPDAVLMDVRLRGGRDGIEAARELRSRHDLALVFLTAYADDDTVDRALRVGAQGYVVKPFSKPQLRAALSTALAGHAERANAERGPRRTVAADDAVGITTTCTPAGAKVPFGPGTRVAIFSHDTLGLGHLQRTTNIARALTTRFPGLSVLLLTGSPVVHRFVLPAGVDYVKLPSVRKVAAEQYSARTLGVSDDDVLRLRANLILRTVRDYDPHVLLVDHAPTGMKGEMLPTLEWLGRERPDCVRLIGLRDVIDDPAAVRALWTERGTYEVLARCYEHVLVYGSQVVIDTAREYGFPDELRARTHYCDYVGECPDVLDTTATTVTSKDLPPDDGTPLVTVTIGGGDGAGELVIGNYLAMLRLACPAPGFRSVILPGPFLPPDLLVRYQAEARELGARLIEFVPSTSPFMARSQLVIGTAGYNTTTQALRFGQRALLIPRVMHRQEQRVRAERLAAMGLVTCMPPAEVTPARLLEQVRALLADPRAPLAEARASGRIGLDGAERVADFCAGLMVRAD